MAPPKQARAYGVADLDEFRARLAELRQTLQPPLLPGSFVAHTDGACLGNPAGRGGWAAVIDQAGTAVTWELYGHLSSTSNNRAEALAVLAAVEWLPAESSLDLRSDSELTVKILTRAYKAKANPDIWVELWQTISSKSLTLNPVWIRAHVGNPGNERADQLAGAAALNREPLSFERLPARPRQPTAPPELAGLVPQGDWEQDFVRSIAEQLHRGRSLSPKQQAIIDRIRARSRT